MASLFGGIGRLRPRKGGSLPHTLSQTVSRDCSDERKVRAQRLCALSSIRECRPVKRPLDAENADNNLGSKRRRHREPEGSFAYVPSREEQVSYFLYAAATPVLTT